MQSIEDKWKAQQEAGLRVAINWAGSPATLAKLTGVTPQAVHAWIMRGRISATAAACVHDLSGGTIDKHDLRPDVVEWWR